MTILVVVPTYRTPSRLFDQCISSLLAQDFADLCVLVLGDGEDPRIRTRRDDRLVVHRLTENRGRYFADAVAQRACPFDWYSPHDADDYSDPRRFSDLWSHSDAGVVWSDHINHAPAGAVLSRAKFPRALRPLGPQQKRQACHLGLYRIDRLRATGMYHPDFRVHYDSLHNSLVKMTGPVAYSPNALYHRVKHPRSLTQIPGTGMRSDLRRDAAMRCRALYAKCYAAYIAGRTNEIAGIVTATICERTLEAVEAEAEQLRRRLE